MEMRDMSLKTNSTNNDNVEEGSNPANHEDEVGS